MRGTEGGETRPPPDSLLLPLNLRIKTLSIPDPAVRAAIATVRSLAAGGPDRPAPATILASILTLEKAKLPSDPLFRALTGGTPAGRRWRLTYTAGAAAAKAAVKAGGVPPGGAFGSGGAYVPITAVQRWAAEEASTSTSSGGGTSAAGTIENGIFLGWLGAFVFSGKFQLDGRRLPFDLDALRLRLGPKTFTFPFSTKKKGADGGAKKGPGPFFLVAYADDAVVVARGASGGVAVWTRAGEEWCARAGVDA